MSLSTKENRLVSHPSPHIAYFIQHAIFFFATCINSKNTYFINIIEILYTCLLLIYKNTFKVILRQLSDCQNCNAIISALISRQTLSEIILTLLYKFFCNNTIAHKFLSKKCRLNDQENYYIAQYYTCTYTYQNHHCTT